MTVPDDRALVLFEPQRDTIYNFDALQLLRLLPDESVHCCVTSPPYFGLRDYGADGQIGLEPTPDEYVAALVAVFREIRRVLRSDGTVWLNLGDSYASATKGSGGLSDKQLSNAGSRYQPRKFNHDVKPKNLIGIPWRVAFALQADGYYLRSDIIWSKDNPMPESVTDRPTRAHEYVFLLTKSPRYWYDQMAIAEPCVSGDRGSTYTNGKTAEKATHLAPIGRGPRTDKQAATGKRTYEGFNERWNENPTTTRNKRSVWTINPEPFPAAHFATMPTKLVETCLLAGCPPKVCAACGAPYKRVMSEERELDMSRPQARRALELFRDKGLNDGHLDAIRAVGLADAGNALVVMDGAGKNTDEMQRLADEAKAALGGYYREFTYGKRSSIGWQPTCACNAGVDSGIVLDPFMGAGTVAFVAQKLNRHWIGSDINPEYVELATMRVQGRLDEYMARQRGEAHTQYMFADAAS